MGKASTWLRIGKVVMRYVQKDSDYRCDHSGRDNKRSYPAQEKEEIRQCSSFCGLQFS